MSQCPSQENQTRHEIREFSAPIPNRQPTGLLRYVRFLLLTLYTFFIGIKIAVQRWFQNLHRYKLIYLEDNGENVHVSIEGEKIYLKVERAQPSRGIRIGNNYYTTKKEHAIVSVKDEDF